MIFKVIIEKGDDEYFVAHCPSLKSCWSQGRTKEEVLYNIREAIELYLEPDPIQLIHSEGREVVELSILDFLCCLGKRSLTP